MRKHTISLLFIFVAVTLLFSCDSSLEEDAQSPLSTELAQTTEDTETTETEQSAEKSEPTEQTEPTDTDSETQTETDETTESSEAAEPSEPIIVAYTVNHFLQNLTGDTLADYTLEETEELTGTAGEQTEATAKNYTGFVPPSVTQKILAEDESTVIEIYYERKTFTVTYASGTTFHDDGSSSGDTSASSETTTETTTEMTTVVGLATHVTGLPASETYRYGAPVKVAAGTPEKGNYKFNGWYITDSLNERLHEGDTVTESITENITLRAAFGGSKLRIGVENFQPHLWKLAKQDEIFVTMEFLGTSGASSDWKIDGKSLDAFAYAGTATVSGNTLLINTEDWAVGTYIVSCAGASVTLHIWDN